MKPLKLCFISLVLFICNNINTFGQVSDKVMPSSPQAYSLGQYADVPVGNATGVPEISIPIYTIVEGKASLPISLSYHASGIKVEQEATWAGLSWTLNAGGMISRSKLGIPDKIGGRGTDPISTSGQTSASAAYLYYSAMFSKSKDSQPDIFYYNFLGYTGKFVLDDLGNPVILETANIKIIPISIASPLGGLDIGGWELIVEDGTKYFFGQAPNSNPTQADFIEKFTNNDPNNFEGYTSGWCLRQIQYVNGQTINFTYTSEEVRSEKSSVKIMQEYWVYPVAGQTNSKNRNENVTFITKRLTSIEGENTKVAFDATSLRSDLSSSNSYALTKVRILTKSNIPVKSYEFISSYFQNSVSDDYKVKRLKLDEVRELSTDGLIGQRWKFFYNALMLPSKWSCAQDLSGYYNGHNENTSLVPRLNETVSASDYIPPGGACGFNGLSSKLVNVGEANRDPDQNSMKACVIDSIVYPTGGSSKYVFEPHSYNFIGKQEIASSKMAGGLRIAEIRNYFADNSYLKTIYTYKMLDANDGISETTKSSGVLTNNPRFYYFRANYLGVNCTSGPIVNWGAPILAVSATPAYRLALTQGSPIGYRQVKVTRISGTSNNGCEVYEYSSGYEHPDIFNYYFPGYAFYFNTYSYGQGIGNSGGKQDVLICNMPVMQGSISYEPLRGLLRKKTAYTSSNLPVNSRTYSYSSTGTALYNDYSYIQEAKYLDYTFNCSLFNLGYSFIASPVSFYTNQLARVDSYDYLNGLTVQTTKSYTYSHNQVTTEVSTDSKGNDIIKKYKYSLDYANGVDPVIDDFKTDAVHILSPAIEEQEWLRDNQDNSYKLKKGSVTTFGSNYLPKKIYALETSNPLSSSLFGEGFNAVAPYQKLFPDDNSYYKEKLALFYTNSTIKKTGTIINTGGMSVGYQWGYNQTYPIAECQNASNNEFYYEGFEESSATGVTTGASHTGKKYSTTALVSWIRPNTRNYVISYWYKNSGGNWLYQPAVAYTSDTYTMQAALGYDDIRIHPSDSQMTTYTYDPLIGITSVTDVKGESTYYEYDSFQRLMNIRDKDSNVIKHIDYRYQSQ